MNIKEIDEYTELILMYPHLIDMPQDFSTKLVYNYCIIFLYKKEIVNELKNTWETDKEFWLDYIAGDPRPYKAYKVPYLLLRRLFQAISKYHLCKDREEYRLDFFSLGSASKKEIDFLFSGFKSYEKVTIIKNYKYAIENWATEVIGGY